MYYTIMLLTSLKAVYYLIKRFSLLKPGMVILYSSWILCVVDFSELNISSNLVMVIYRQLSADNKMINYMIKNSFISHKRPKARAKFFFYLIIFHFISRGKLSVIWSSALHELVPIQQIVIGFEAIVENRLIIPYFYFDD